MMVFSIIPTMKLVNVTLGIVYFDSMEVKDLNIRKHQRK